MIPIIMKILNSNATITDFCKILHPDALSGYNMTMTYSFWQGHGPYMSLCYVSYIYYRYVDIGNLSIK